MVDHFGISISKPLTPVIQTRYQSIWPTLMIAKPFGIPIRKPFNLVILTRYQSIRLTLIIANNFSILTRKPFNPKWNRHSKLETCRLEYGWEIWNDQRSWATWKLFHFVLFLKIVWVIPVILVETEWNW